MKAHVDALSKKEYWKRVDPSPEFVVAFIPGDPAALADAVTTLLDHPEQATRLADRGRQWVLTERTGAAHGQLYQDVYQELMDRWRPAGQPAGRAGKPT